jgi:hypothetical protein
MFMVRGSELGFRVWARVRVQDSGRRVKPQKCPTRTESPEGPAAARSTGTGSLLRVEGSEFWVED